MNKKVALPHRGPEFHQRRDQIVDVAYEHFRHYGYKKTSVGDIAAIIGVSNAYIYKFFSSKKDIAEVVCAKALQVIDDELMSITEQDYSPPVKLRMVFKSLLESSVELMAKDSKVHEIAMLSFENKWCSNTNHQANLHEVVEKIVVQGREDGIFECNVPLDEVCLSITDTMFLISHPLMVEQHDPNTRDASLVAMTNMILRSLAV
ncbi:TetR/AcrR family transcriptional regulator [Vibrio profundum]|uniref:TetR family transcriptional regulator n=1 Tax=Vibrio profundum TaxID=2910247 RepID=UPI003D0BE86D